MEDYLLHSLYYSLQMGKHFLFPTQIDSGKDKQALTTPLPLFSANDGLSSYSGATPTKVLKKASVFRISQHLPLHSAPRSIIFAVPRKGETTIKSRFPFVLSKLRRLKWRNLEFLPAPPQNFPSLPEKFPSSPAPPPSTRSIHSSRPNVNLDGIIIKSGGVRV